jgi:cytochrome b561
MTAFHWLMLALSACVFAAMLCEIASSNMRELRSLARILVIGSASVGYFSLGCSGLCG